MIKRYFYKVREVGVKNAIIGFGRRTYYKRLRKKYNFGEWHTSPYELRSYAQDVVKYINADTTIVNEIVDVGCGLGDIIRNVKAENRFGFDLDENVIKAAKFLDVRHEIEYCVGSFEQVGGGRLIDYLIAIGFMHGANQDYWTPIYRGMCEKNDIQKIIVDVMPKNTETNSYELDFSVILGNDYCLVYESGPFGESGKKIQCWFKMA